MRCVCGCVCGCVRMCLCVPRPESVPTLPSTTRRGPPASRGQAIGAAAPCQGASQGRRPRHGHVRADRCLRRRRNRRAAVHCPRRSCPAADDSWRGPRDDVRHAPARTPRSVGVAAPPRRPRSATHRAPAPQCERRRRPAGGGSGSVRCCHCRQGTTGQAEAPPTEHPRTWRPTRRRRPCQAGPVAAVVSEAPQLTARRRPPVTHHRRPAW